MILQAFLFGLGMLAYAALMVGSFFAAVNSFTRWNSLYRGGRRWLVLAICAGAVFVAGAAVLLGALVVLPRGQS